MLVQPTKARAANKRRPLLEEGPGILGFVRKHKDASQKDSQIFCGFDRDIDRFTCARGADCAP
jgi:hypothetical protein